jgi:hypothetical protein
MGAVAFGQAATPRLDIFDWNGLASPRFATRDHGFNSLARGPD